MSPFTVFTVAGALLKQDYLLKLMNDTGSPCFRGSTTCFLLDDGAFVIASSDLENNHTVSNKVF